MVVKGNKTDIEEKNVIREHNNWARARLGKEITSLLGEGFHSDETPYQEGNDSHLRYGVKIL